MKRKSSKAQIQMHLFIYIAAILLVALIIIFGYRAISSFREKGEQATLLTLKTDLSGEVDRVSLSFGEVSIKDYSFPAKYSKLCFVDDRVIQAKDGAGMEAYPIMQGAVESGSDSNVFLVEDVGEPFTDIGPVHVPNQRFICADLVQGRVKLRFEWAGRGMVDLRVCDLNDPQCLG